VRVATYIVLGCLVCFAWVTQARAYLQARPSVLAWTAASAAAEGENLEGSLPVDGEPGEESDCELELELELDSFLLAGRDGCATVLAWADARFVWGATARGPRGVFDSLERPPRR